MPLKHPKRSTEKAKSAFIKVREYKSISKNLLLYVNS